MQQILDAVLHIDQHLLALTNAYGPWIYAILFIIVFSETGLVVTPFLPGDSLLFAAGSIAAIGKMDVHSLALLLVAAAFLGNMVNFTLGKFFGRRLFANAQSRIFRQEYLRRTEDFYARHGGATLIITRFVPIIRTFAPFVAGMTQMPYARFLLFTLVGALLWVGGFVYGGYFFGNLPFIKAHLSWVMLGIIVVSFAPIIVQWLKRKK